MRVEFGSVEWEELQSPWSGGGEVLIEVQGVRIALVGEERKFQVGREEGEVLLVWDVPGGMERSDDVLCVVNDEAGRCVRWERAVKVTVH